MVDLIQERQAVVQPGDFKSGRQMQTIDSEVGRVRVPGDLPGIVPRTEKSGMLARPGQWSFDKECWQVDAARDAVVAWPEVVETRRIRWPIIARGHLIEERPRLRMAGQDVVRGDEMVVLAMGER